MTVKNPCIDPAYTSIIVPDDYSIEYPVNSDAKIVDYTIGFSVGDTAEVAALCGPI